jgi:hypothetical protein
MGISPTAERPVIVAPTEPAMLRRRGRQRFGRRIQWETVFFGLLSAVGLAAVLTAMLIGGLIAAGVTDLNRDAAALFHHLVPAGGAIAVAILALSYLTGGYVAGRMARFDGWRQGLGVWLLSLLMVLAVGIAAWISGGAWDPTDAISLPANPVDTGPLSEGRGVILAVAALVPLLASVGGGILGERYHRAVDDAAFEPEEPEPEPEPEPEAETEVQAPDQPYGPDRVRQDADASAASSSEDSTVSPAASP